MSLCIGSALAPIRVHSTEDLLRAADFLADMEACAAEGGVDAAADRIAKAWTRSASPGRVEQASDALAEALAGASEAEAVLALAHRTAAALRGATDPAAAFFAFQSLFAGLMQAVVDPPRQG